jgi:hypothetical protein
MGKLLFEISEGHWAGDREQHSGFAMCPFKACRGYARLYEAHFCVPVAGGCIAHVKGDHGPVSDPPS